MTSNYTTFENAEGSFTRIESPRLILHVNGAPFHHVFWDLGTSFRDYRGFMTQYPDKLLRHLGRSPYYAFLRGLNKRLYWCIDIPSTVISWLFLCPCLCICLWLIIFIPSLCLTSTFSSSFQVQLVLFFIGLGIFAILVVFGGCWRLSLSKLWNRLVGRPLAESFIQAQNQSTFEVNELTWELKWDRVEIESERGRREKGNVIEEIYHQQVLGDDPWRVRGRGDSASGAAGDYGSVGSSLVFGGSGLGPEEEEEIVSGPIRMFVREMPDASASPQDDEVAEPILLTNRKSFDELKKVIGEWRLRGAEDVVAIFHVSARGMERIVDDDGMSALRNESNLVIQFRSE